MLDDRQYRTDNPCGDGESLRCPEALHGSYSMLGSRHEAWAPMIPFNPHIKFYEGDRGGYFSASVTPQRMRLDLRVVTSEQQTGSGDDAGSRIVEDGHPGAIPA